MKIEIDEITEMDDGGARIVFTADSEVMNLLAAEGFLAILKREIENARRYHGEYTEQKDLEECIAEAGALR